MIENHPSFDRHKLVTSRFDQISGLRAIIAVHDDTLGPAIGGCRVYPYASFDAALRDVLRLSRGMTYKTAISNIPYGGGKAVIIADPATSKTPSLLEAMGDFVESLGGAYITSFDSGTSLSDVEVIATRTSYAAGTLPDAFDASQSTADGVYVCLRVAAEDRLGTSTLSGVRVAIQGVGNVGSRLARLLNDDGADLYLADVDQDKVEALASELGAGLVDFEQIHQTKADIFSPNALGAVLNAETIPELRARVIVGGANNQLATSDDDMRLRESGISYCPDYLANAGGIINLHYQRSIWSPTNLASHIAALATTLREVLARAESSGMPTGTIANHIAEERIRAAGGRR